MKPIKVFVHGKRAADFIRAVDTSRYRRPGVLNVEVGLRALIAREQPFRGFRGETDGP